MKTNTITYNVIGWQGQQAWAAGAGQGGVVIYDSM